jgi:hypothetical protein
MQPIMIRVHISVHDSSELELGVSRALSFFFSVPFDDALRTA